MIDIPQNEKVPVGKAIEFLRRKKFKSDPAFKVERFIEEVCSKATYTKLRKTPLKESEIYDRLLKKLGLVYPYDENDPHIQKYMEQLHECYLRKADMIDFDCWTHCIEILEDPTITFDEYIGLNQMFDGSLEDVNVEDKKTIAELENMLGELRRHVGDEGYQDEMTGEDIYEDSQENDEEYEL